MKMYQLHSYCFLVVNNINMEDERFSLCSDACFACYKVVNKLGNASDLYIPPGLKVKYC